MTTQTMAPRATAMGEAHGGAAARAISTSRSTTRYPSELSSAGSAAGAAQRRLNRVRAARGDGRRARCHLCRQGAESYDVGKLNHLVGEVASELAIALLDLQATLAQDYARSQQRFEFAYERSGEPSRTSFCAILALQ